MFKREVLFQKNKMQPKRQNLSVLPQGEAQELLLSWAVLSSSDEMLGDFGRKASHQENRKPVLSKKTEVERLTLNSLDSWIPSQDGPQCESREQITGVLSRKRENFGETEQWRHQWVRRTCVSYGMCPNPQAQNVWAKAPQCHESFKRLYLLNQSPLTIYPVSRWHCSRLHHGKIKYSICPKPGGIMI